MRKSHASALALALAAQVLHGCANAVADDRDNDDKPSRRATSVQATNLTRTALKLRDNGGGVLVAFGVDGEDVRGPKGSMQPAAMFVRNGSIVAERQINVPPYGHFATSATANGHDAPSLVHNADGSVFEVYGAATTYAGNHPPPEWSCFHNEHCQPFKFADAQTVRSGNAVTTLATSPELLLPSVGISELSTETIGDVSILAGQEQPSDIHGEPGTQAYITYHAHSRAFDTDAGPYRIGSGTPPGDGLETLSAAPSDDAVADVPITAGGNGTMQFSAGGERCSIPVGGASPTQAAREIAETFAHMCGNAREFSAMEVRYDPTLPASPAIVGFTSNGDPARAPLPAVTCGGALTCGPVHDVRGGGLHRHFLFGGVVRSGPYLYYLMDVQQATGTWFAAAHNSYALRLACFRTLGPSGAQWRWTDCAGNHPFVVEPGALAPDRVSDSPYVVRAPAKYGDDMTPYVFSNAARAQVPQGAQHFAVISAESLALLPDGRVMIVHGCQSRSGMSTVCYAILNGRTAQTERAALVDPGIGGSLANVAVTTDRRGIPYVAVLAGNGSSWRCRTHAVCLSTYRFDLASQRWQPVHDETLAASATDGFPGALAVDGDAFIVQLQDRNGDGRSALATLTRPIP